MACAIGVVRADGVSGWVGAFDADEVGLLAGAELAGPEDPATLDDADGPSGVTGLVKVGELVRHCALQVSAPVGPVSDVPDWVHAARLATSTPVVQIEMNRTMSFR